MSLLLVIAGIIFIFGLVQWARSGVILWDIQKLLKNGLPPDADDDSMQFQSETKQKAHKKERLQKSIQSMETMSDGLLRSSFKILGVLALAVWIFIVVSVVVDMLGLDWMNRLSFSTNRILGNPTARSTYNNTKGGSGRNSIFRSMGSGVRR